MTYKGKRPSEAEIYKMQLEGLMKDMQRAQESAEALREARELIVFLEAENRVLRRVLSQKHGDEGKYKGDQRHDI